VACLPGQDGGGSFQKVAECGVFGERERVGECALVDRFPPYSGADGYSAVRIAGGRCPEQAGGD
jgi:hypothetical protein